MSSTLSTIFGSNPVTTIGNNDMVYVDVAGSPDTDAAINGTNLKAFIAANATNASNLSTGTLPDARLSNVIAAAGPIGDSTHVPQITFDAHGRLTTVTSVAISGGGAVTSVAGRTGAVTLAVADVTGAAPLASPTFTGTVTLPSGATNTSAGHNEPLNMALGGVSLPGSLSGNGSMLLPGESCMWGFDTMGFKGIALAVNECPTTSGTFLINPAFPGWSFNMQVDSNDGFFVNRVPAMGGGSFVNMLSIDANGQVKLSPGFTVSTLPTGIEGSRAYITDHAASPAPAFNVAPTGGGSIRVSVFYNGSAWVVG